MKAEVSELLELVKHGEMVIVEHETSYVPEFLLKLLADYTRESGVPFVIEDYFDSLYTLLVHSDILGLDVDIDHSYVLKIGGRHELGGTVRQMEFHPDPRVFLRNYDEASSPLNGADGPALHLVLGFENVLYFVRDVRDFYRLLLGIQRYVGNKQRKTLYLLPSGFFANLPPYVLPELRRIATGLWVAETLPTGLSVSVRKSSDLTLIGMKFEVELGGDLSERR